MTQLGNSVARIVLLFIYWLYWVFLCCAGFSLVEASRGYSLVAMHRLLIEVASLVEEHRLPSAQA